MVRPQVRASVKKEIISEALAHIIWAPRIRSVSRLTTILIKPRSCPVSTDFPLALMGYFKDLGLRPCFLASSRVSPTEAISGSV